jgi:hypothetical protein
MYGTETFKDLIEMIEVHEHILFNCNQSLRKIEVFLLQDDGCPTGYKNRTSYEDYDTIRGDKTGISFEVLKKLMEETEHLKNIVYLEEDILRNLKKSKDFILTKLNKLEGIKYKIAYLKEIKGKSIQEIADELGYAYQTVANTLVKIKGKN